MPKVLKVTGAVVAVVVALLAVVPFFIPKSLYLHWAVSAVEDNSSFNLQVGDAGLSFLPIVSVKLKDVTVTRKGEKAPWVKAERLDVGMRWRDLIFRKPTLVIGARNAKVGDSLTAEGDVLTKVRTEDGGKTGHLDLSSSNLTLSSPGALALKREDVSFESDFSKTDARTEIRKGQLSIGPQSFAVSGTQAKSGALDLTLASERLNLDYLKKVIPALKELPPVDGAGLTARVNQGPAAGAKPTVSGEIKAKKVSLPDQELTNLVSSFVYRDPLVRVENLRANTMDGTMGGNASLNLQGDSPKYDFDMAMKNVAMDHVSSVAKLIKGRGDLSLKGHGQGTKTEEWSKFLSGDGNLTVRQIRIPAMEVFQKFVASPGWDLVQKIPGLVDASALKNLQGLDTRLNDLASAFRIVNGVIQVPHMNLQFPQAAVDLAGGIGLDKVLNFSGNLVMQRALVATFVKNPQLLDALTKSGALTIPIKIGGTTTAPIVAPDDAALRGMLQSYLHQQVQQKAGQMLKDAIQNKQGPQDLPKPDNLPSKQDIQDFLKKF